MTPPATRKRAASASTASKRTAKKTAAKKTTAKKSTAKKTTAKKTTARKSAARPSGDESPESTSRTSGAAPERASGGETSRRESTPRESSRREPSRRQSPRGQGRRVVASVAARAAVEEFEELTRTPVERIVGVRHSDDGWTVQLEATELRRTPPTMDVLALYEVQLTGRGQVAGWERVTRYHRSQVEGS